MPLPLTLPSSPLETPTSYLSRLAARNFAPHILDFAIDLGLDFAALTNGKDSSVRHLCACAGLPENSFAKTTVVKTSTMKYGFGKEVMTTEVLDRGGIRYCPCCLLEGLQRHAPPWTVIHQASWQIVQIRRCTWHGMRLRRYSTKYDPFTRFDFTRILAEGRLDLSIGSVEDTADALDFYLEARLRAQQDENWCNRMQLPALIKAVEAFGVTLNHGRETVTSQLATEQRRDAMLTGFEVLSLGKDGIVESLRDFTLSSRNAASSPQEHAWARFGALQRLLGSHAKMREDLRPLREIVREFFLANFPFKVGTMVLGEKVTEERIVSMRTACRAVGARQSLVEEMLIAQGLAERDASGRFRLFNLLTPEIVFELCHERFAWLNQAETAAYLGCSFAMFQRLARSGLLAPTAGNELRARKGFYRKDLDAFLQRIFVDAPRLDIAPLGCFTLEQAARKAKCSAPDIIRMIFDGDVRPVGRVTDRLELRGLLANADGILEIRHAQEPNGHPTAHATSSLYMTKRTLDFLVEQGLLEKRRMKSNQTGRTTPLITAQSYLTFDAIYCTLGKLQAEVPHMPLQQHSHLKKAGIEPAIQERGITRIYKREELRAKDFLN
ncbi:hypothetical protein BV911_12750 [Pseudoruegeria sp. SK021]|nr:hypothetical protein BV911_12750 [Pseudoruegeria sp. SK021]